MQMAQILQDKSKYENLMTDFYQFTNAKSILDTWDRTSGMLIGKVLQAF